MAWRPALDLSQKIRSNRPLAPFLFGGVGKRVGPVALQNAHSTRLTSRQGNKPSGINAITI